MLQKNRHSIYDLEYHLVVVTKYRHPVIADSLKERLIELSYDLFIAKWNLKIIEMNSDMDHIHILFEGSPQVQLSKLVNNYKTVTSRLIRKEFGESLKPYYENPPFWSSSYFICTVSDRSHEQVKRYILDQSVK